MEIRLLVDAHFGQASVTDLPEYQQPEWVGRTLRLRDILEPGEAGCRKQLFGKNLRVYLFSRNFLAEVIENPRAVPEKGATDFCVGCVACPYRSHGCPMQEERMAAERIRGCHVERRRPHSMPGVPVWPGNSARARRGRRAVNRGPPGRRPLCPGGPG
jgi:hypothetical protein